MKSFGVRFEINDEKRFEQLCALYSELKRAKDRGQFPPATDWVAWVPDEIKSSFNWPTPTERDQWLSLRDSTPILIANPDQQLGRQWDFYRVFESLEEGEYSILDGLRIDQTVGELHIDPQSYPYGGVGPLIALAEAFGFKILGVNEYGKYQPREQLLRDPV